MAAADSNWASIKTYPYACAHCGGAFERRKDHGRDPRFCSYTCRGAATRAQTAARRAARTRVCRQCRQPFVVGNSARLICSPTCRRERTREQEQAKHYRVHPLHPRACRECGTTFVPTHGGQRLHLRCKRRRNRKLAKRARRIAKGIRRAKTRGVAVERIDPIAVFTRDHWCCQLCGCSTPKRLRGRMVDCAPELDHIHALSAGGTHTWSNVQCLCRKCNIAKGATTLGQLRF